jgi:hypothetical protein
MKCLGFGIGEEAAFCADNVINFHLCNIYVTHKVVIFFLITYFFPMIYIKTSHPAKVMLLPLAPGIIAKQ